MLNLLERLKESPIGKQLESDFAKQTLAKRRTAVSEIKKITAEEIKVLPGLLQVRERAKDGVEAAQEAVQKAKEAYDRAHGAVLNVTVPATARRNEQEQILRGCYSEEIDKFKEEIDELLRLTRLKGLHTSEFYSRDIISWKKKPTIYSNRESVHQRIDYLRDAIAQAEQMKLEALEPEKLTARLKEIRRKLPQTA